MEPVRIEKNEFVGIDLECPKCGERLSKRQEIGKKMSHYCGWCSAKFEMCIDFKIKIISGKVPAEKTAESQKKENWNDLEW